MTGNYVYKTPEQPVTSRELPRVERQGFVRNLTDDMDMADPVQGLAQHFEDYPEVGTPKQPLSGNSSPESVSKSDSGECFTA